MKKLNRCLLALGGIILANAVLAEDWSEMLKGLTFTPSSTDLSVKYLVEMFGRIQGINQFKFNGTSILSVIFGVFNAGLLAISGVFLSYTFIKILTNTAIDGSAMGKSTTVWVAIRCALSTSLLVPQSTGYSTINVIIMWIIMQSVGFANLLWNKSLDYIHAHDGQIFVAAGTDESSRRIGINLALINGSNDSTFKNFSSNKHVSSKDVLDSLVCSYSIMEVLDSKRQSEYENQQNECVGGEETSCSSMVNLQNSIIDFADNGFGIYKIDSDEGSGDIKFPYVDTRKLKDSYGVSLSDDLTGICGKFSYDNFVKRTAALRMLDGLNNAARMIVDKSKIASESDKELSDDLGVLDLVDATLSYQAGTESLWAKSKKTESNDDGISEVDFSAVKGLGWLFAGSYYYHLMNTYIYEETIDDASSYLKVSKKYSKKDFQEKLSSIISDKDSVDKWKSILSGAIEHVNKIGNSAVKRVEDDDDVAGNIQSKLDAIKTVSNSDLDGYIAGASILMGVPLGGPPFLLGFFRGIPIMILHVAVNNFIDTWKAELNKNKDAIFKIQNIGESLINQSMFIFKKILELNVGIGVGGFAASAIMVGIKTGVAAGTFWGVTTGWVDTVGAIEDFTNQVVGLVSEVLLLTMPILLGIAGPMLASGLLMAVYLPLLPTILFLFGGMSWFISVLVLMFAAPLICFLMLWGANSQDNLLLTREAEQFVMQVIAIFFRPALMVIGLLLGAFIFNIGVSFLNEIFIEVYELILGKVSISEGGVGANYSFDAVVSMFKVVGVIVVYVFILLSIANLAYSCIYTLYNEVMRVIGISPPAVGLEEQYAETVKGGVSRSNDSFGQGLGGMASSTKGIRLNASKFNYDNLSDDNGNASMEKKQENNSDKKE